LVINALSQRFNTQQEIRWNNKDNIYWYTLYMAKYNNDNAMQV